MNNEISQVEKTATVVIRKIRDAILDDVFKPGEWLPEVDLAARFKVSRSPIREALQALENEGTVTMEPYKGAIVKPLSPKEALDIAELRLASSIWRRNRRTGIFPRLNLNSPPDSPSKSLAVTAPKNTSI